MPGPVALTVGHSNLALDAFLDLVAGAGVRTLVDTRSHPYSRWVPHFSRESLREAAAGQPFGYRFMGDSLGGKPERRDLYHADGAADYEAIARQPFYLDGIGLLLEIAGEGLACLLCAEEDPVRCHRWRLLAGTLRERGVTVRHLRRDGTIESEAQVRTRFERERPQMLQGRLELA